MSFISHSTVPASTSLAQLQAHVVRQTPTPDGWLIYDFRGLNPHAASVLGLGSSFLTRRYFVWIPSQGRPVLLHHRIEGGTWTKLLAGQEVDFRPYSAHSELDELLHNLVAGRTVAMEYSPQGAVPYVSRVDGGTLERVRAAGANVVSSADLLQAFQVWSEDDLVAHLRAVDVLMTAKDRAFEYLHQALKHGEPATEYAAQQIIEDYITEQGMVSGHPANVSFGANAADPHYEPSATDSARLQPGQCVLIDLWAQEKGRPFADVTWVGYAGEPSAEYMYAFEAVAKARDTALALLQNTSAQIAGQIPPAEITQGWQVDRAARQIIDAAGLGEYFTHRLGHSLGVQIHGAAVNLDDLETHDTRTLLPGLAVTIEPGVYVPGRYGIRSEINVLLQRGEAILTTPVQSKPFVLGGEAFGRD